MLKLGWHFIGVYIINRTLHGLLEIQISSSRVEKYFTRSLEEKFRISLGPCNILYIFNECGIECTITAE